MIQVSCYTFNPTHDMVLVSFCAGRKAAPLSELKLIVQDMARKKTADGVGRDSTLVFVKGELGEGCTGEPLWVEVVDGQGNHNAAPTETRKAAEEAVAKYNHINNQ